MYKGGDKLSYKAYVGTYTGNGSEGVYTFSYDNKSISNPKLFAKVSNPKYLCFVENYIAAVVDFDTGSGVIVYDEEANIVDTLVYEDGTSCYICYEDEYIYTVNYHEGTLSVLRFKDSKLSFVKKIKIKDKAGSHQVLLTKDKIMVPCLFLDKIVIIDKKSLEIEDAVEFEVGAGPRHGLFSDDGRYLYTVGELSNRLYTCDMESKQVISSIDLLENGENFIKDSAAIRKKDKFIYVSTRTKDVLTVLMLDNNIPKRMEVKSCYGKHPRDFIIQDNNIIVANRLSNKISLINIKGNGTLGNEISKIEVPEAISIIIKEN